MSLAIADFEKLGSFYLGRRVDPESHALTSDPVLYDARDLTTHALCVGMTGSGKTGLCIGLLEEAAIDGVPAIAIDPKGDLGNLMLTFPDLAASDFEPWVDPAEATRQGETVAAHARRTAARWREGLAEWGQGPERIERLRRQTDLALYTPGSRAGRPLRVLGSLAAPDAATAADPDALAERVEATVSGLLTLVEVDADPIRSRQHILLSNLLARCWNEGRGIDFGGLIAAIQKPPFDRIGVLDLESFYPARERFELAMRLNNLLASPGFEAWMEGEPLDIPSLLYGPSGRPRISVVSIAHLGDRERMFFVTQLLNEMIAWMRTQPGTSSLRALLYMDEIFGFFPPTANPPSKPPMLTLLKQARAFGVGVVLATQNPVDLDYKGLSNCGTWFLGRLQTERDKLRVLDGLEGASAAGGSSFDRGAIDRMLSGLGSRVFLMNNVHEREPTLLQTRWVLSYLRGPLTRTQTNELAAASREAAPAEASAAGVAQPLGSADSKAADRPLLPPDVPERFASPLPGAAHHPIVWRPALAAGARLHFTSRSGLDHWSSVHLVAPLSEPVEADPWSGADALAAPPALEEAPLVPGKFSELPAAAARPASYRTWQKQLASHVYRECPLVLWRHPSSRQWSQPGQSEAAFRASLRQSVREKRDLEIEKLGARYRPKLERLRERIARAEDRVAVQQGQLGQKKLQTAVSIGATVLGALFGRKMVGVGTVSRAATAARSAGAISREHDDVRRAEQQRASLQEKLAALEAEFEADVAALELPVDPSELELEEKRIRPRKGDLALDPVALVWLPWRISPQGLAEPAF